MKFSWKKKYRCWIIGLLLCSFLLYVDHNKDNNSITKTTILVNAPESMHYAFEETLSNSKLNKEYEIEFTTDSTNANFIVTQGSNGKGNLLAYSPIIAVFNSDEQLYQDYIDKEIFVTSEVDSCSYDFDFEKIIDIILEDSNSNIKVYYPSKNSDLWEEFYNFLLFTVNDGYYPKSGKTMQDCIEKIETFLNSKNAESIDTSNFERLNGFSKNSIYFTTFSNIGYLHSTSGLNSFRIMYPKTVVYHSYYVDFDEVGKILYDALDEHSSFWNGSINYIGYYNLYTSYYHTKYYNNCYNQHNLLGARSTFNGIEVPITENLNSKED